VPPLHRILSRRTTPAAVGTHMRMKSVFVPHAVFVMMRRAIADPAYKAHIGKIPLELTHQTTTSLARFPRHWRCLQSVNGVEPDHMQARGPTR